jgi:hypothetical protein
MSYGKSSQRISRPSYVIKLSTIISSKKDKEIDDSSSTHQLADLENGLTYDAIDVQYPRGVHTVICSRKSVTGRHDNLSGIFVQNDTVVEVDHM